MKNLLTDVVVFDIETELMGKDFFDAQKKGEDTFNFMPTPRVCVCYDSLTKQYETFLPENFQSLYEKLLNRRILSFNGVYFDVKVILKYLNKKKNDKLAKKKDHYDLLSLINKKTGKRYKLDELARANFNERKHTDGRDMQNMDIVKLTEACQSDVDHTYRLMEVFLDGKMIYKYYRDSRANNSDYVEDQYFSINLEQAMLLMKINEKRDNLSEAMINGHKYSESDKITCLDEFLLEKTGKCFNEIINLSENKELKFEERCINILELLLTFDVSIPMDLLEENLTEGQLNEYYRNNL